MLKVRGNIWISKSVFFTFPVLKVLIKEGSHLRCKTTNKCLNVSEQAKIVERNKDDPLPSSAFMWIADVNKEKSRKKLKFFTPKLQLPLKLCSCKIVRIQINPSSTLDIGVMMKPHRNIKNFWAIKPDNSRMKKRYEKSFFRAHWKY